MTENQKTQQKLEEVYALYSEERGRIEEISRKVTEMDRSMVTKAFDHALQKIIDAKTPSEAKRHIDTLEYILVASPGFTSIRKLDKSLKGFFGKFIKVSFVIGVIAFLVGLILKVLGK